ncbi:MAG TPA: RIP metalloprotease RseP, partial [Steroidobacteraceae bacterium]|nr:RIP metalloprotease RseP [Steroidobacteraceae bacterium]
AVSLLVTVHEFGHFWVARKLGFKVLRFSVGFGKPIWKKIGRAPDHTEYVVAALPLGGYVRMLDERDGTVPAEDLPRAFTRRPPWQRILVLLAGPAANILFAILVLWGLFWVQGVTQVRAVVEKVVEKSAAAQAGLRVGDEIMRIDGTPVRDQVDASLALLDAISGDGVAVLGVRGSDGQERSVEMTVPDPEKRHKLTEPFELFSGIGFEMWTPKYPAILARVLPDGPAAKAGLKAGDQVVAIDGKPIANFNDLQAYVKPRPGAEVLVTVRRGNAESTHRLQIASVTENGRKEGMLRVERIDDDLERFIPPEMRVRGDPGPIAALGSAITKSWQMTAAQAKFFVRMLTGKVSTKNISGFISIADYAGKSARAGAGDFLMLMVLLSLSLGFLNLLPIPILDGGQIVFQVAEWAKGGPLSERTYMVGQQAGLVMLVLLMGLALFNDLSGIFRAAT